MKRFIASCILLCLLTGCQTAGDNTKQEVAPPLSKAEAAYEYTDMTEDPSVNIPASEASAMLINESSVSEPDRTEKFVAFTFDDGPGDYTSGLLDELAKRGAKATFFISTNRVSTKNSDLILRMDLDGHEVENHTVSHSKLHLLTTEQIIKEISCADKTLMDITGKTPEMFRPPYGNFTTRVLKAVGKPAIVWSIDTRDCFDNKDARGIQDFILERVTDGDIILLHEWGGYSRDGALAAMDVLAEQGYRFVTVTELFAAKGIAPEGGHYYAAANGKDFEERLIFDKDDKYPEE